MREDIEQIKERNRRVETDKAWEISKTRRVVIAVMTYLIVVIFLWSIDAPNPFFNAIVPTIGFIVSTLTLPFVKRFWLFLFSSFRRPYLSGKSFISVRVN